MSSSNGFKPGSLFALEHSMQHLEELESEDAQTQTQAAQAFDWNEVIRLEDDQDTEQDYSSSKSFSQDLSWDEEYLPIDEAQALDGNSLFALEQSIFSASSAPYSSQQSAQEDEKEEDHPIESQAFDWDEAIALEYNHSTYHTAQPTAESMAESFNWLPTEDHDYGFGLDHEPATYEVEAFEVVDELEPETTEDEADVNPVSAIASPEPAKVTESPQLDTTPIANDESPKVVESPKFNADGRSPDDELTGNQAKVSNVETPAPAPATIQKVEQNPIPPSIPEPSAPIPTQPKNSDAIPVQAVVVNLPTPPSNPPQPQALAFDFDQLESGAFSDQSSDAEAFAADIAAILRGEKIYEPEAESSPPPAPSPTPAKSQAQSLPPKPPSGHDIFDQMGMSYATAFDLGTFSLQQTFDEFDEILDEQESAAFGYEDEKDNTTINTTVLDINKVSPEKTEYEGDRTLDEKENTVQDGHLSVAKGRGAYAKLDKKQQSEDYIPSSTEQYFIDQKNILFAGYTEDFVKKSIDLRRKLGFGDNKANNLVKALMDFLNKTAYKQQKQIQEIRSLVEAVHQYLSDASNKSLRRSEESGGKTRIDFIKELLKKLNELRETLINDKFLPVRSDEKDRQACIKEINDAGIILRQTIKLAIRKYKESMYFGSERPEAGQDEKIEIETEIEFQDLLKINFHLYDENGNKFSTEDFEEGTAFTRLGDLLRGNESLRRLERHLEPLGTLIKRVEEVSTYVQDAIKFARQLNSESKQFKLAGDVEIENTSQSFATYSLSRKADIHNGFSALATLKSELSKQSTINAQAELAYRALLVAFKARAEGWIGIQTNLNAQIRLNMQELSVELGWDVEAAVKLSAYAEAYLKFGALEIEANLDTKLFAGARCAGDFKLKIDPEGLECAFEMTAFAGAKVTFDASAAIKLNGKPVQEFGFQTSILSGVGYDFKGEFKIEAGKIKIRLNLEASLGLGLGLGLEFAIDTKVLAEAIAVHAYSGYAIIKAKAKGYTALPDLLDQVAFAVNDIEKFKQEKEAAESKSNFIGAKGRDKIIKLYCSHAKKIDAIKSGLSDSDNVKNDLKGEIWQVFVANFEDLFSGDLDKRKSIPPDCP